MTEQEAEKLMNKLIYLRNKVKKTKNKSVINQYQKHQQLCVEKFKYLITMRTNRYKGFSNHDDLNQEGYEALLKAMNNYDPKKGSFFWWAHKYIETRISRSANLHTTIRYPLKFAKQHTPHRESILPILIEAHFCPDRVVEEEELWEATRQAMKFLDKEQIEVVSLVFGFHNGHPLSINKVCKKLDISRAQCIKVIRSALNVMRQKIKI